MTFGGCAVGDCAAGGCAMPPAGAPHLLQDPAPSERSAPQLPQFILMIIPFVAYPAQNDHEKE